MFGLTEYLFKFMLLCCLWFCDLMGWKRAQKWFASIVKEPDMKPEQHVLYHLPPCCARNRVDHSRVGTISFQLIPVIRSKAEVHTAFPNQLNQPSIAHIVG